MVSLGMVDQLDRVRLWLARRLEEFTWMPTAHSRSISADEKWRTTSAWQKAIRRGNEEQALVSLHSLWRLNPEYVLYRMPIILLEDVGMGDPELTLSGMVVCGRQVWLREWNPERVLAMLTGLAARAVKDRTVCDLTTSTDDLFKVDDSHKLIWRGMGADQLEGIAADPDQSPDRRQAALWALAGTKRFPGESIPEAPPAVPRERFERFVERTFGAWALFAHKTGANRMGDGMPVAAVLARQWLERSGGHQVIQTPIPADPFIGGVPASSFDWYTREGRLAMSEFLRSCPRWRLWLQRWVTDTRKQKPATAMFLWRIEGELLDRRLVYGPSEDVRMLPVRGSSMVYGIPLGQMEAGYRLLAENLPLLHEARRKVVR